MYVWFQHACFLFVYLFAYLKPAADAADPERGNACSVENNLAVHAGCVCVCFCMCLCVSICVCLCACACVCVCVCVLTITWPLQMCNGWARRAHTCRNLACAWVYFVSR